MPKAIDQQIEDCKIQIQKYESKLKKLEKKRKDMIAKKVDRLIHSGHTIEQINMMFKSTSQK